VILVDSSVWIDYLRNRTTAGVTKLESVLREGPLLVGDLVLCEILQGLRNDAEAQRVESVLRGFELASLCEPEIAVSAAANCRFLRARGITIRQTIDLIIGTFCIERGHALLHSNRDFEPMERLLGLQTV
jgi:hypothetical protein